MTAPNWAADLESLQERFAHGSLAVTLKKHEGKVANLDALISVSYKEDDYTNADYAALVLRLINDAIEKGFNGGLSFTVNMKDGVIKQLVQTDHKVINYMK